MISLLFVCAVRNVIHAKPQFVLILIKAFNVKSVLQEVFGHVWAHFGAVVANRSKVAATFDVLDAVVATPALFFLDLD